MFAWFEPSVWKKKCFVFKIQRGTNIVYNSTNNSVANKNAHVFS
jgi:hypothetical protein